METWIEQRQGATEKKERKKVEAEDDAWRERDITNKCSEVKRGVKKVTSMGRRGRREQRRQNWREDESGGEGYWKGRKEKH